MPKVLLLLLTLLLTAGATFASSVKEASSTSFPGDWRLDFRNLTFVQLQKPVESLLNTGNRLKLSRYLLGSQFRPDLTASLGPFDLLAKPRLELQWTEWEENNSNPRSETDVDLFIQEWQVRWQLHNTLFLSYGRENLQWGPSYMLSPSNPFSFENGKNQPKFEIPSADFARLTWLPGPTWTGSLIVNTDEGRKKSPLDFFKPTYAMKFDSLMDNSYFSLIISKRETQQMQTGFFGSYNLEDALLIYAEGNLIDDEAAILVGGTYTFANGSMLAMEYFHNGAGAQKDKLFAAILAEGARRLFFLRRNYGMLQYVYQPPINNWSLLLRWTHGIDDNSSILLGHGEYDLGEYTQLFLSALVLRGDREDEFSSLLEYRATFGIEVSF